MKSDDHLPPSPEGTGKTFHSPWGAHGRTFSMSPGDQSKRAKRAIVVFLPLPSRGKDGFSSLSPPGVMSPVLGPSPGGNWTSLLLLSPGGEGQSFTLLSQGRNECFPLPSQGKDPFVFSPLQGGRKDCFSRPSQGKDLLCSLLSQGENEYFPLPSQGKDLLCSLLSQGRNDCLSSPSQGKDGSVRPSSWVEGTALSVPS